MKLAQILGCFLVAMLTTDVTAQMPRQSGNAFLSPDMLRQNNDASLNPLGLWLDQGQELFKARCQTCHSSVNKTAQAVVQYPKWQKTNTQPGRLWNLEDQIAHCASRQTGEKLTHESAQVVTLSVFLSDAAKGMKIQVQEPTQPQEKIEWQAQMNLAAQIYVQRQGRLNLSCTQCHDQQIGKNLRSEVVSPGYITGFPIYRQAWQTVGSIDRRLRACYSGVQASVPATGSPELRALELFLKKRSEGMVWDGPSLRR